MLLRVGLRILAFHPVASAPTHSLRSCVGTLALCFASIFQASAVAFVWIDALVPPDHWPGLGVLFGRQVDGVLAAERTDQAHIGDEATGLQTEQGLLRLQRRGLRGHN
jgi:hypothetical protein